MIQEAYGGTPALPHHLLALVAKRLQKLEQCLDFSSSEDPVDAVHDLRVASRRLRAFGAVFRDAVGAKVHARLEKRLRRVAKAAGALRDSDVQIGLLEGRAARASGARERAGLEHLLEELERERWRAARKAEKRLRKVDLEALSSAVTRAARDASTHLASNVAQQRYAAELLLQRVANAAEQTPPNDGGEHAAQLHRLRIRVKELRYALELFEPLLGPTYALLYERATAVHELLGTHHDLAILGELVGKRSLELEQRQRAALSSGLKVVEKGLEAERLTLAERFRGIGFDRGWWLENLTSALGASGSMNGSPQFAGYAVHPSVQSSPLGSTAPR